MGEEAAASRAARGEMLAAKMDSRRRRGRSGRLPFTLVLKRGGDAPKLPILEVDSKAILTKILERCDAHLECC